MQYLLTADIVRHGVTIARGSVLADDVPERSIFYVSRAEAEALLDRGLLAEHAPGALTGEREEEPGWRRADRTAFDARAWAREEGPWPS